MQTAATPAAGSQILAMVAEMEPAESDEEMEEFPTTCVPLLRMNFQAQSVGGPCNVSLPWVPPGRGKVIRIPFGAREEMRAL